MNECFAKLPKRVWKVFVRADSAFSMEHCLIYLSQEVVNT